jgi:hypothetical protein
MKSKMEQMTQHTGASYDGIAGKYAETVDVKPWNAYVALKQHLACIVEPAQIDADAETPSDRRAGEIVVDQQFCRRS